MLAPSMDPKVLVAISFGTQISGQEISLASFMNGLHLAFFGGVVASALGALASLRRSEHCSCEEAASPPAPEREGAQ